MEPLQHLSNFWRALEMLLFDSEISLFQTWSANCVISSNASVNQPTTFTITNTKLYLPVVTLSIQEKVELLQQLK